MKRCTILLADDHSLLLGGIRGLLERDYKVVGAVDNGKSLVAETLRLKPHIIVLDITMPVMNGIDAAREIRKSLPDTKFVFLSMHSTHVYVRKALEAGASAYVLKSGAAEELLKAIEIVRKGGTFFSPGFGSDAIEGFKTPPEVLLQAAVELTGRQRTILQLIAEGKQNKEIASLLFVSVKTIEFHRNRLMTKLGIHSVAELTRFAIQEGLVSPIE